VAKVAGLSQAVKVAVEPIAVAVTAAAVGAAAEVATRAALAAAKAELDYRCETLPRCEDS